jgi:hypothetical protein
MKKIIILIGIVFVLVVIYGVAMDKMKERPSDDVDSGELTALSTAEELKEIQQDRDAIVSAIAAVRYRHPRLGFSFEKPEGYTVGLLKGDDGSETLIVQPANGNAKQGFQIFMSPVDSALSITPQLVQKELPGTAVIKPLSIELDGRKGMMFESNNDAFNGRSYEIWFSDTKTVYQVTSYAEFASELQRIIGTWRFN